MGTRIRVGLELSLALLAGSIASVARGGADDDTPTKPEAEAVIGRMGAFFAKVKAFSVVDEREMEVGGLRLRQRTRVDFERPTKLAVRAVGGAPGQIECICDGKSMYVAYPHPVSMFTKSPPPKSSDELGKVIGVASLMGSTLPDLMATDPVKSIAEYGKSIYEGVDEVDGIKAHHLSRIERDSAPRKEGDPVQFRWDLWIPVEGDPVPIKATLSSGEGKDPAPEATHRLRDWKIDPTSDAKTFTFEPPAGYKESPTEPAAEPVGSARPK